ncbi:helix-turn-helix domain-containing protein [Rhodobacterales bacterium HKCCE2091]|nr:helix-turn-helix domain-containing protein [Rhodobacterales bacterium HKCCE2091]
MECGECPIRTRAVCSLCEPHELNALDGIKSYREIPAGKRLYEAGEPMEHVASVVLGVGTLSRTLEDGRRQMVGLLLPSDFIGRPGRAEALYDVEALTDLTVCRFERKGFERILGSTPNVATRLLQMTLDELDSARDWAVVLGRKSARERVASFLLILARRLGRQSGGEMLFQLPVTREAMADYLGLTLETTSRQMSALRRDGVIATEGRSAVRVPDLIRLAEEAGDDSDGVALV